MTCPNRKPGYSTWICHCSNGGPRVALANLYNGWLSPDSIRRAREIAKDAGKTDAELTKLLGELERDASHAHGFWEMGN